MINTLNKLDFRFVRWFVTNTYVRHIGQSSAVVTRETDHLANTHELYSRVD